MPSRRRRQSASGHEGASHVTGAPKEGTNGGFILEDPLIDFDAAKEHDVLPTSDGIEHGLRFAVIANTSATAFDAKFQKHIQRASRGREEFAQLIHLFRGIDQAVVGELRVLQ